MFERKEYEDTLPTDRVVISRFILRYDKVNKQIDLNARPLFGDFTLFSLRQSFYNFIAGKGSDLRNIMSCY